MPTPEFTTQLGTGSYNTVRRSTGADAQLVPEIEHLGPWAKKTPLKKTGRGKRRYTEKEIKAVNGLSDPKRAVRKFNQLHKGSKKYQASLFGDDSWVLPLVECKKDDDDRQQ